MNKNVLIISTLNDHFNFFFRMVNSLRELDYDITFLTNKYSIKRICNYNGIKCVEIKNKKPFAKNEIPLCLESYSKDLTEKESHILYNSTYNTVSEMYEETKFDLVFIWSGIRLIEATVKEFAKENTIPTLFFEVGNLKNKLFVDPNGTNAQSSLANNPGILKKFADDSSCYENWKTDFIESGLKKHLIPQGKGIQDLNLKKHLIDLWGFRILGNLQFEPMINKEKFINKFVRKYVKLDFDNIDYKNVDYVFYPMQVKTDAQLLINSKIGNLEALERAASIARKGNMKLLVKQHPAEKNFGHINEAKKLKEKLNFYFVEGNTLELIYYSKKVVTINSTVGLQALIMDKDTECFSKTFYQSFGREELSAYICNYLIDTDFWGSENIDKEVMIKILDRAAIS